MAFGDYVSSSAERDMAARARSEIGRGLTKQARPQQMELLQTYQELGMDPDDARAVVNVFSKYKDILIDEKMTAQKGMLPPQKMDNPLKNGVITFVSFILFGSAPLLSFIILIPFTDSESIKFTGACVLSALALAVLGLAKAKITGENWIRSVAVTLCNGAVAAASAYLIGWLLREIAGLKD